MRSVKHTSRFRRDYKRERSGRQGKQLDAELLEAVTASGSAACSAPVKEELSSRSAYAAFFPSARSAAFGSRARIVISASVAGSIAVRCCSQFCSVASGT